MVVHGHDPDRIIDGHGLLRLCVAPYVSSNRPLRDSRFGVGARRRDGELDLRTRIHCTPHAELTSNEIGTLAHATQAVVPLPASFIEHLGINSDSVVPNAQPKLMLVVPELHFNLRTL